MRRSSTALVVVSTIAVTLVVILAVMQVEASRKGPLIPEPVPGFTYNETRVALPGFNPLLGHLRDNNCPSGCGSPVNGSSQIPVLSNGPGAPFGIYYVNNASELTEVELYTGIVRDVAHVTPLYQTYSGYDGMIPNEFTISNDYGVALFFGTVHPDDHSVSVETVNLATGAMNMVVNVTTTSWVNQQATYVGNNIVLVFSQIIGSSQVAGCLADCRANVTAVNMVTGAIANVATLPFFEANNIYWLPRKGQLINVEAHGAFGDTVEDVNVATDGFPPFLVQNPPVTFAVEVVIQWVNGVAYNSSPDNGRIAFSAGGYGVSETFVLDFGSDGILTSTNETTYPQTVMAIQQYAYTSTYVLKQWDGAQYLFNPWNGSEVKTNEPFTNMENGPVVCDGPCFLGEYAFSLDWLIDWHASEILNDPFWSVVVAVST